MFTITRHVFINIFQTEEFPSTVDYENYRRKLSLYQNLEKLENSLENQTGFL